MVDAPYAPAATEVAAGRRPLLGYALVWSAVAFWGVNATVSKVVWSRRRSRRSG